jgi:hypothetical protein
MVGAIVWRGVFFEYFNIVFIEISRDRGGRARGDMGRGGDEDI